MNILKLLSCTLALFFVGLVNAQAVELTHQQEQQIKSEIIELVNDYAIYRDTLNAAGYAGTFIESGRIRLRGEWIEGRETLRKRIESADPNEVTMHVVGTGHIDVIDFDTAVGIQYMTVYIKKLKRPRAEDQVVPIDGFAALGKYDDKYVRTDEGWKFVERKMTVVFTSEE